MFLIKHFNFLKFQLNVIAYVGNKNMKHIIIAFSVILTLYETNTAS